MAIKVYYSFERVEYPDIGRVDYVLYSNEIFQSITMGRDAVEYPYGITDPWDNPGAGRVPMLVTADGIYHYASEAGFKLPEDARYMFAYTKGGFSDQAFRPQQLDFRYCLNAEGLFYGSEIDVFNDGLSYNFGNVQNAKYMLYGCTKLNSATLSLSSINVSNAYGMFSHCTSLVNDRLHFSNGWTATNNLTDIRYMFSDCTSLTTTDFSFNTARVSDFTGLFSNCTGLTEYVNRLNMNGARNLDEFFSGCTSLEQVDVSSWNLDGVGSMNNTFQGCTNLFLIKLPRMRPEFIDSCKGTYANCPSLRFIYAPIGTDWDVTSLRTVDSVGMFTGSTSLPNWNPDLTDIAKANNLDEKLGYYVYEYSIDYPHTLFEKANGQWDERKVYLRTSEGWDEQSIIYWTGEIYN